MFKFFRKIRYDLLDKNKTAKYFKYAIGEVFLVVIGILIALWINNQNQDRIKQEKVDKILITIQEDIALDISYSDWLITRYIEQNTLKDKVFNNQFDFDNLTQSDLSDIELLTRTWANLPIQTSGYNQLTRNIEDIPDDYQELVRRLNFTYRSLKDMVDLYSKYSQQSSLRYFTYLGDNHPWFAEYQFSNEVSPAMIHYYKNNPQFKSRVYESMSALSTLIWANSRYRSSITKAYVHINDKLQNRTISLPYQIRDTTLGSEQDAQKYVGIYENQNALHGTETLEITAEGKNLFSGDAQNKQLLIYYHEQKPWFGISQTSLLFMFDDDDNNTLRVISGSQKTAVYKRRPGP